VRYVVSGMLSFGWWWGMDLWEKVAVQNCGRAVEKLGGVVLAP